jgi:NADH-quinone oxidoreductase subunit M
MTELHLPWLGLAIVTPLLGALWIRLGRDPQLARQRSLLIGTATLALAIAGWIDFVILQTDQARDPVDMGRLWGKQLFVLDNLSAPLLPLAALIHLLTTLATLRTKVRRFSFAQALVSESILLATFSCNQSWCLIALLAVGTVPPWLELRARERSTRIYRVHMGLFILLLVIGWFLLQRGDPLHPSLWAIAFLAAAVLLRSGIVPVHCWMTDLFENATFGTALLFVTPMVGAYAAVRLVLPIAPIWGLRSIALMSLLTAVYTAGMALVQREPRRFFCYLFLSHSSLVLVGLETGTPIGLTGALCVWPSVGLALTGFGLTLRSLEARTGNLLLDEFHGLYEHTPTLAAIFLMTGLASVGFPGTFGFVGTELLMDGAVQVYPLVGLALVFAAALNGVAVLAAYFRLFTGTRHRASISLQIRTPERFAVLTLAALIIGGGLIPQPWITSRYEAAAHIFRSGSPPSSEEHAWGMFKHPVNHGPATTVRHSVVHATD